MDDGAISFQEQGTYGAEGAGTFDDRTRSPAQLRSGTGSFQPPGASGLPGKLIPPETYGLVSRRSLLEEIERAPRRGLTWISAPPGAGKSSLGATWLSTRRGAAHAGYGIWYRVDETDAVPSVVFHHLKRAVAGSSSASLPDLAAEALSDLEGFAEGWFRALLEPTSRPPYLFVFDDLHRLPPDCAFLDILAILSGLLGDRDRLVCMSRQDPPCSLAASLGEARLARITDLSVHPDEYEDFKRVSGHPDELTRDDFLAQLRQSGHWISDLVVTPSCHLTLRRLSVEPSAGFAELFCGYSACEKAGLLASAFLQAGHEEEWRHLGGGAAAAVLNRLAEERGLVTRLVDGTLRKHDLFHECLRAAAVRELTTDALTRARLDAGRLLLARDELLPGTRMLIEAGAPDEARDLVLERAGRLIGSGRNLELIELIEMLPETMRSDLMIRVWHAYGRVPFDPEIARIEFAALWREIDPRANADVFARSLFGEVRAALANWSVDQRLQALADETKGIVALFGNAPERTQQRFTVARCLAILIGDPAHPEVQSARCELEAVLPGLKPSLRLFAGSMLARYLLWWSGELAAARAQLEAVRPFVGRPDLPIMSTLDWYFSALGLAFREGDDEALNRLTDEAKAFADQWGLGHRLSTSLWITAQAQAGRGDHSAAAETRHLYERIVGHNRRWDFSGPPNLRAALALSAGDHELAIAEGLRARALAAKTGSRQDIGNQDLLLAMAFAVGGDDKARHYIDRLRDHPTHSRPALFGLHADLGEIYLAHAQGRTGDFVGLWQRMAHAAVDLNFRRISGLNASSLSHLANKALGLVTNASATRQLIRLWHLAPPDSGLVHEDWPYPVEIACLGGFGIKINGKNLRSGQGKAQRKPLDLLGLLTLANGRGLAQELLAEELWPGLEGERAMHTLRTTVYRLRKMIGAEAVVQEHDHLRLDTTFAASDLGRLRTALARAQDQRLPVSERYEALDQVLRLYRGPLLPGVDLAKVGEERESLPGVVVSAVLTALMTLDRSDPAIQMRLHRLRAAAPGVRLPAILEQLWAA